VKNENDNQLLPTPLFLMVSGPHYGKQFQMVRFKMTSMQIDFPGQGSTNLSDLRHWIPDNNLDDRIMRNLMMRNIAYLCSIIIGVHWQVRNCGGNADIWRTSSTGFYRLP
jgi:hypothetical protein